MWDADFLLEDDGSLCLLTPRNESARRWLCANTSEERTWFGHSVVVEPRFLTAQVAAIRAAVSRFWFGTSKW
jgi:hypothetical protein